MPEATETACMQFTDSITNIWRYTTQVSYLSTKYTRGYINPVSSTLTWYKATIILIMPFKGRFMTDAIELAVCS